MANEAESGGPLSGLNAFLERGMASPLFGLGVGLLSAPGGATFGQALGRGVATAGDLRSQRLRNEALREGLHQQQARREEAMRRRTAIGELQELIHGLGGASAGGATPASIPGSSPGTGLSGAGEAGQPVDLLAGFPNLNSRARPPAAMDESGAVPGVSGPRSGQVAPSGAALSPQQVRALSAFAAVSPEAAAQQLVGLLGPDEPQEFQTTPGKLAADFALAERRGDVRAMAAIETEVVRRQAEAQSASRTAAGAADLGDITRARNDFIDESSTWLETRTAFDRMQAGAQQASAAGDVSLVFSFMKALDPGSVVREGEQATARNAASVPERIRGAYNRVLTGESLTPKQRADFLRQGQSLLEKANKRQQARVEDTRGFATRNRLPVEDVVPRNLVPEALSPGAETGPGRTVDNPLTPREREELESLRRSFGGG